MNANMSGAIFNTTFEKYECGLLSWTLSIVYPQTPRSGTTRFFVHAATLNSWMS